MRKILLILLFCFLSQQVSAQSLGSLTYESDRTARVTAEYELGVFNLGNRSLEIELSSDDFEGDIDYGENSFVLEPSRISSNPTGSGWISISGNRYVKPRNIKFSVRAQRSQDFTVDVRASSPNEEGGSGPSVVQVQSHSLSYTRTSDPTYSGVYESDRDQGIELRKSQEENTGGSQPDREPGNRTAESIRIPDPSTSENREKNGISPLTLLLSIGAAGSLYYLWSVL